MEDAIVPRDQVFLHPWFFLKESGGLFILALNANGAMMPLIVFDNPAAFRDFVEDGKKAYDEFVPVPVREAMDILENFGKDKDTGKKEDGGKEEDREPAKKK